MVKYEAKVDGKVVGTRKTARTYTHAIVVTKSTGELEVMSFHNGTANALDGHRAALKLVNVEFWHHRYRYTSATIVEVTPVELKTRSRVRCTGLVKKVAGEGTSWKYIRVAQCLKDAVPLTIPERCNDCRGVDNAQVRSSAMAANQAMEQERREEHMRQHPIQTCATCGVQSTGANRVTVRNGVKVCDDCHGRALAAEREIR